MTRGVGAIFYLVLLVLGTLTVLGFVRGLRRHPAPKRTRRKRAERVHNADPANRCHPGCTGLPSDGYPLSIAEREELFGVERAATTTVPEPDYSRRPRP